MDINWTSVKIEDDFDLRKIAESGQCFRVKELEDGIWRFVTGEHVLYIRKTADEVYEISCTLEEWNKIWTAYFDLGRSYKKVREMIPEDDKYLAEAARAGQGIRILLQEPWETLCSFIISQRKNIPAIKSCVEKICALYGTKTETPLETLYLFPSQEQILAGGAEGLCTCSLGYRLSYVRDAAERTCKGAGDIDLEEIGKLDTSALLAKLMEICGVGIKVANCTALFAYGRTECAPVDVWIGRVIDERYGGINPFEKYGDAAGIMQQYMYFGATNK